MADVLKDFILSAELPNSVPTPLAIHVPLESISNAIKGDTGPQGPPGKDGPAGKDGAPGPQGPAGGANPYSDPNFVDFCYTLYCGFGAGNTIDFDFPYGLVFALPPHVQCDFVMGYPSEQYSNFTPNWSGWVQMSYTNNGQNPPPAPSVPQVSRTQFTMKQPGLWMSFSTIQVRVWGFIDPVATAQNQKQKNITPPEVIKAEAIPIGEINFYYNEKAIPSNYLPLKGQQFDKNVYPDLYTLLGTDILDDMSATAHGHVYAIKAKM